MENTTHYPECYTYNSLLTLLHKRKTIPNKPQQTPLLINSFPLPITDTNRKYTGSSVAPQWLYTGNTTDIYRTHISAVS